MKQDTTISTFDELENRHTDMPNETICAISTPYGIGGLAVVRVSGYRAIDIAEQLIGKHLTRVVHLCRIPDLDDVVVTTFHAPHSFTGEDTVEISCHGSLYVQQELLRRLTELGCRMAKAGEFTQRAFLNGQLDLTQAEAVADLIAAETKAEKDLALAQIRGSVSTALKNLREQLLTLTSLLELELDFADHEELEFADRSQLYQLVNTILQRLRQLTESFHTGNAIRNGIPVAIIGPTNAGKSTLLNALLGEERAIVSHIAGTTRDTVEDRLVLDGILFRLVDTAGIRPTDDPIENLGIERSRKAMAEATLVLYVTDATITETPLDETTIREGQQVLHVRNKCDLISTTTATDSNNHSPQTIYISAQQGDITPVTEWMKAHVQQLPVSEAMLSNARHYQALTRAREALNRVADGLQQGLSGEWLSLDLRDCLNALGEVTGEVTNQEVLHTIFSRFCIGK